MKKCCRCHLEKTRTRVVLPKGSNRAEVMFIGEAPGETEDKRVSPFCGSAGKWLKAGIDYLCLSDTGYYLTNVLKCRPVDKKGRNRKPRKGEIELCGTWLKDEIKEVEPKIIVLLGGTALDTFFANNKISHVAGYELKGHKYFDKLNIKIFALFHPAVLLYNEGKYKNIYEIHLNRLKKLIKSEGIK